jgi:hypothetical protein
MARRRRAEGRGQRAEGRAYDTSKLVARDGSRALLALFRGDTAAD